jgi:polyhydroxyalkanoate synthesis regulator phasin
MEFNDIFKKMMDATMGMVAAGTEKVAEFTEHMSQKGQDFQKEKKQDIDEFFEKMKKKLNESTSDLLKNVQLKNQKIDLLEKEVQELKKEVQILKNLQKEKK